MPGNYTVSLVAAGKTIESKPMKIVMDPQVQLADAQRRRYNDILMDLHSIQQRGTTMQTSLDHLYSELQQVAPKVRDGANVPAATKTEFDAFMKEFDALRVKFGVPTTPDSLAPGGRGGGGRGGRGGRGCPANTEDVLARAGTVKNAIGAIWEMPSDAMVKQYNEVKADLTKAIADAGAFMTKATAMSKTLLKYDITLMVPMSAR